MKEIVKDLFKCIDDETVDAICITTNGQYSDQEIALMGGGCAGVCSRRWPETAKLLGNLLVNRKLNIPYIIGTLNRYNNWEYPSQYVLENKKYKCLIFSYPTIDNLEYGSNIKLIERSSILLKEYADKMVLKNIVTVRMGSGIGGLDWYKDVRPIVKDILDDRFTVCCQENDEFRAID